MLYLSPSRDEYYMVATGNSLALNRDIQEEQIVPARYRQEFLTIALEQVHLRIPLSRSEKCIVGTGLERQVALDSGVSAIAEHEGNIIFTDTDKIFLFGNGDTLSIPLTIYQRSNKNTCMHQNPHVQQGKCIKKGQVLADGAATVEGELALGKNSISSLYAMGRLQF
ncbi:DNA-directed RNA polymerase subunit beta [Spatholobus suberectus]|nr:DNA-directed RNA polymerase subunit beta [Spatholobus suberectus]